MSEPGKSISRNALQITPMRVAAMSDGELNALMEMLIKAQAQKCDFPISEILINTQGTAPDDGCDGWSAKPSGPDDWLGLDDTCWQFKAGANGTPARLRGEVTKRIPQETLAAGGRFVVIASGSTSGRRGEQNRRATLVAEAQAADIPAQKIAVIGSERLALWCNQHPAIAAYWAGRPSGLWTFDDWSNSDEHQVPWQEPMGIESEFASRRAELQFETGTVLHLHIKGPAGVGKTRFALELCRAARWRREVIYIRQASDFRLAELIDSVVPEAAVQLVVVADEVQFEQLQALRDSVGRGSGRVRLITIGHCSSPDPNRIPLILIKPLERRTMVGVISGWHPAMPQEHVDFVTAFADGYVRLARLAANVVVLNPSMDVPGLLRRDEIRGFFNRMLGAENRRALHVVAVLTSVGWTDEVQGEGEAVARHLGQDWDSVRAEVEHFHDLFGIAPRGGRYRYISPTPLGIHLAVEAWETYPDRLKSLPDVLPSETAVDAYYERLRSIASNPQAREFACEQLAFFFRIDDFIDPRAIRRWAALSSADPAQAARNVLEALSITSIEDRKRIVGDARRRLVWDLVRLAWNQSSFHDATMSLALLAEAENETWANNASAEFTIRFQIALGGTATPFMHRLELLDELLAMNRPSLARLVINALAQAIKRDPVRVASEPISDEVPEQEWRPRTSQEYFDCLETAMQRLTKIAKGGAAGIEDELVDAAKDLANMLRDGLLRPLIAEFLDAVRENHLPAREPLRRAIAEVIAYERRYWKTLSAEELETLEQLHHRFEDASLGARLQQQLAQAEADEEGQTDLKPLAMELMSDPDALAQHWPWLTSGDAADGWRLGQALAAVDPDGQLANMLPHLPGTGSDLRVISGYICSQRQALGDDWYETWLRSQSSRAPKPFNLLFDVAWRCRPANTAAALLLAETMQNEEVSPAIVGRLGFGRWEQDLPLEVLDRLLQVMTQTGHDETAIVMLINRINSKPNELDHWKPLCLRLVTTPDIIRGGQIANFYWKGAARRLITEHARDVAAAILSQHQNRNSGAPWLIAHSETEDVLRSCAEQDPTGVWQAIQPYLSSPLNAEMFSIGFPSVILAKLPPADIKTWIAQQPEHRAPMVAHLAGTDLSNDATLTSIVLGEFGDNERIAHALFNKYISGPSWGPISSRWNQLAQSLEEVAGRTKLPKLRRWAQKCADTLRRWAEDMRRQEEEEELHRR